MDTVRVRPERHSKIVRYEGQCPATLVEGAIAPIMSPTALDDVVLGHLPREQPATARKKRYAAYVRFSSEGQDVDSIVRQIEGIKRYLAKRGVFEFVIFQGVAQSAMSAVNRDSLQTLVEACKAGDFDCIVVEYFDRWTREVFDAVELCEVLLEADVEFHCALEERVLGKEEMIEAALEAGKEAKRRRTRLMMGLNKLVREGGVPWGLRYGYERTDRPGFPKIYEPEAAVVRQIYILRLERKSFREIARILNGQLEKAPVGPRNKRAKWSQSHVAQILKCPMYVGLIYYRVKTHKTQRKKKKSKIELNVREKVVKGVNPALRIISPETYEAVQKLRLRRPPPSPSEPRAAKRLGLVPFATCDCPSREGQRFMTGHEAYLCSCAALDASCKANVSQISAAVVEREVVSAVLGLVADRYDGASLKEEYVAERSRWRSRIIAEQTRLEARRDELDGILDGATKRLLEGGIEPARARSFVEGYQAELAAVLAELETIRTPSDVRHLDPDRLIGLERMMGRVKERLPFGVVTEQDALFQEAFRRIVRKVVVKRWDRPLGDVGLEIEIDLEALFFAEEDGIHRTPTHVVSRDFVLTKAKYTRSTFVRDAAERAASQGVYALTDRQWDLVGPLLPDMGRTDHSGDRDVDTRTVANAVIFKLRFGSPLSRPPSAFGPRTSIYGASVRFIYAGGVETLVEVLGGDDPRWLDGLDLKSIEKTARAVSKAKSPRVNVRPTETVGRMFSDGRHRLTDEQWLHVEGLVDPSVGRSRAGPVDPRLLIEAAILKFRSRCGWRRLPAAAGDPATILAGVHRLAYSGSWDRIEAALNAAFPDVLAGLNTTAMATFGRRAILQADAAVVSAGSPRPGFWLSQAQFDVVVPLLPRRKAAHRADDRRTLSGILHVLSTGCGWRNAPVDYGRSGVLRSRYVTWKKTDVWPAVFDALAKAGGPLVRLEPRPRKRRYVRDA